MVRRSPDAAALAALLALLALAACADAGGDVATPAPPALPPAPAPAAPAEVELQPSPALTPSATPQQVIDAVPIGRVDPFAPTTSATATGPATTTAAALPGDLRLTGVIGSGGDVRAFVQRGSQTGALCLGSRGRCADGASEPVLLPAGWTVSAIDPARARLVLSSGRQRRILALAP